MGELAEYYVGVNMSREILHETEENLISTSPVCPAIYILGLKHRIH